MSKNIWVEKLGLPEIFIFAGYGIGRDIRVRYTIHRMTRSAAFLVALLRRAGIATVFVPHDLVFEKKDLSGHALEYTMEEELDASLEQACRQYCPGETQRFARMVKTYLASHLFFRQMFISMIESEDAFRNSADNSIYLVRHPLNRILISYYRGTKGYRFRQSWISRSWLAYYLNPLRDGVLMMLAAISHRGRAEEQRETKPAIWIEYCHGNPFDITFWKDALDNKDAYTIAYYLDRQDRFSQAEKVKTIEATGLGWIDLRWRPLIHLSGIRLRALRGPFALLMHPARSPAWLNVLRYRYELHVLLYRSVFKRYRVKVLIPQEETSWRQEAQAVAIDAEGGILVGFNWSNLIYRREPQRLLSHHLYFVWGKIIHDCIEKVGVSCRYVLPSGIWIAPKGADGGRVKDLADGLDFIMTVFDSSVDPYLYQSHASLDRFYHTILEMLRKNPRWGAIVKSKNWELEGLGFLPHGGDIIRRMKALVADRRLVFLNHATRPLQAMAGSDIAVCFSINSAGVIAGIYGYRAIHWDCAGWLRHPFYRDKGQRIVYRSLEDLEEALTKAGAGDRSIGDFSRWGQAFNHFMDFAAAERVGGWMGDFLGMVAGGMGHTAALHEAVGRYRSRHGVGDEFFTGANIWDAQTVYAAE